MMGIGHKVLRHAVDGVVTGLHERSRRRAMPLVGTRAILEPLETRQLLSQITGAYLFYNNSPADGNNPAINAGRRWRDRRG